MNLSAVLLDYMRRFIRFGSAAGCIWFVGLEQGGGENLDELERRLAAWRDMGARLFADFEEYCRRIGERRWHGDSVRIQPTLGKLVRLLLASKGTETTSDAVRFYQSKRFGAVTGESMIAELMPLPSRSVSDWIYAPTGVPGLETRDAYVRTYRHLRIEILGEAIRTAAPQSVVFLGLTAAATWSEIAHTGFSQGVAGAQWGSAHGTRFVIAKHPTAFGAPNSYFEEIGRELARR